MRRLLCLTIGLLLSSCNREVPPPIIDNVENLPVVRRVYGTLVENYILDRNIVCYTAGGYALSCVKL